MKFHSISWTAIFCLLVMQSAVADEKKYTQADLQALASQSSWKELIEHLGDVSPTERNAQWEQLAEQAGLGELEASVKREDPSLGIQVGISLVDQYPQLKKSKSFMNKRSEVGLQAFDQCLNHEHLVNYCGPLLKTFVAQDADNLDLAFKAAKISSKRMKRWFSVSFFKNALSKPNELRSCKDGDAQKAVLAALALNDEPDYKVSISDARVIVRDDCWDQLKDPVRDAFHEGDKRFQKNTCDILKDKNALGKIDATVCANLGDH